MSYLGDDVPDYQSEENSPVGYVDQGTIDADDLGFSIDSDACREMIEDIGTCPPWPLSAVKSMFDRRYPGWDHPPKLSMSSPVRRLRGLCDAVSGGDGEEALHEALSSLGHEVKHAQIKVMCPRDESSGLGDECQFLLLALEQLGAAFLRERELRRREQKRASERLEDSDRSRKNAMEEASLIIREELRERLEDLAAEAERHRHEASELREELERKQAEDAEVADLEVRLKGSERALEKAEAAKSESSEEVRILRSRCSALSSDNEELENRVELLERQLKQGSNTVPPRVAGARVAKAMHPGAPSFNRGLDVVCRLQKLLHAPHLEATMGLRLGFLAWKFARLKSSYDKAGEVAAADSLEADLAFVGAAPPRAELEVDEHDEGEDEEGGRLQQRSRELSSDFKATWMAGCATTLLTKDHRRPSSSGTVLTRRRDACRRHALRGGIFFALMLVALLLAEPHLGGGW
mmetsp:Transcript_47966/g.102712  ORF Transcript_47966/g.102712 Transcript_47966/m.102712 type:complete len:465 (+) Transcript_47966:229-1623(+)